MWNLCPLRCAMFPRMFLSLIDPKPFVDTLTRHPRVSIRTGQPQIEPTDDTPIDLTGGFFNLKLAEHYNTTLAGKKVLFVCDIRSTIDHEAINDNQIRQAKWHTALKPEYSLLKFRIPRIPKDISVKEPEYANDDYKDQYEYFAGILQIQMFNVQSSTETRLVVPKVCRQTTWSLYYHEGKMMKFNRIYRAKCYNNPHRNMSLGIDNCFDCTYMCRLIDTYFKKFNSSLEANSELKNMKAVLNDLNNTVGLYKKLKHPEYKFLMKGKSGKYKLVNHYK